MAAPADFDVVLWYKYTPIADVAGFMDSMRLLCGELSLTGRILAATEGINGTLAGRAGTGALGRFIAALQASAFADFSGIDFKRSSAEFEPFESLVLKNVEEIISSGGTIPAPFDEAATGLHLAPADFHDALLRSSAGAQFAAIVTMSASSLVTSDVRLL
jgi:UPF0176 protein